MKLEAGMTGVWIVTTQGSQHIWNLDEMTYQRVPGEERQSFSHDGVAMKITRVDHWPEVGQRSWVWFDEPGDPLLENYRISSTIKSIEPLYG